MIHQKVIAGLAVCAAIPAVLGSAVPAGGVDWTDREVRRRAVVETAYAYYLKGDCVQYGSVPLMAGGGMDFSRRTKEGKPEDATPDSTYYTVCSSFTYETYLNAIGFRHSGASDTSITLVLTTRPQEAVVFDYDKRNDPDGSNYEPAMMRMREMLEPGDIIVYSTIKKKRHPKTGEPLGGGHALIYVGDEDGTGHPLVMHSGGAKYDFKTGVDQVERSGTVRLDEMEGIFFHGDSMRKKTKIMVFRPLDLPVERYPLTESAKARYLYPRLRVDRCVETGPYGSVVAGDTLNYSIELRNFSKRAYVVPVRETVPEGCILLPDRSDGAMVMDGAGFGWNVELAPGEKRTVRWCVKVTAPAGGRIVAGGGTAAGLPSNTLVTEVVPHRISAAQARAWAVENIHCATNLPDCRVEGWAGGRRSPEPRREVRVRDPKIRQLMEGDVIVVCGNLEKPESFKLWVKGRGGLEEATPRGIRRVKESEVTALLAKPFFAALRPARLNGDFGARQRAVVSKALEYYKMGSRVQHSPTGSVADVGAPADTVFMTPLSFVNDVCSKAIGVPVCDDPSGMTVSNLVVSPPREMVVFEYDMAKDPGFLRYEERVAWMWSIVEPGDVIALMTDHPTKKGKPGKDGVGVYVGDVRKDGHTLFLRITGDGSETHSPLARKSGSVTSKLFDSMLHARSEFYLKERSKVVVLRPCAVAKEMEN